MRIHQLATAAAIAFVVSIAIASPTQADLVAHYRAEGNANDSAGSHHGSLINGAGFGAGISGQAFQFNGTNQYVSAPDSPDWAFGNGPFTVSAWANFNSIRSGPATLLPNVFVGQDEGPGTVNKWDFYYTNDGKLGFHINGPVVGIVFIPPPTAFVPALGSWHLYSVTRSGSTYTFYADGTSLGGATSSLTVPNANSLLTIGQAEGLGYFDGRIDSVSIYDRALSGSEIAALAAVPEPAGMTIVFVAALLGCGFRRKRRVIERNSSAAHQR